MLRSEEKSFEKDKIEILLIPLRHYCLSKKRQNPDLPEIKIDSRVAQTALYAKYFSSPLDVAKYVLANMIKQKISDNMKVDADRDSKQVNHIDYRKMLQIIFIGFKINEYLEQPKLYDGDFAEKLKTRFTKRNKYAQYIAEHPLDFLKPAEDEMKRLYVEMTKIYFGVTLPEKLPNRLKTGSIASRFFSQYSNLHEILSQLYGDCYVKFQEKEALKNLKHSSR